MLNNIFFPTSYRHPDAPTPHDDSDVPPPLPDLPTLSMQSAAPGIHRAFVRPSPQLLHTYEQPLGPRRRAKFPPGGWWVSFFCCWYGLSAMSGRLLGFGVKMFRPDKLWLMNTSTDYRK